MPPADAASAPVAWYPCAHQLLSACLGEARFAAAAAALSTPPSSTCVRVNTLLAQPDAVREQLEALACEGGGEPRFTVQAAHALLPEALLVRCAAASEALDLSAACGREVAVTRRTAEAVLRGAQVYAPGVCGASSGLEEGQLVVVTAVIEPLGATSCGMTRGTRLAVDAGCGFGGRLVLGVGRAALSRGQIFRAQEGLAVSLISRTHAHSLPGDELAQRLPRGCLMLQNLPSVCAARALSPLPGSRVLDMCASPGGKTSLLAALMRNTGELVALDVNAVKLQRLRSLCAEMGVACLSSHISDACAALASPPDPEREAREAREAEAKGDSGRSAGQEKRDRIRRRKAAGAALRRMPLLSLHDPPPPSPPPPPIPDSVTGGVGPPPWPPQTFDAILCDAPCSALGLRPRLSQPVSAAQMRNHASYTRRLLRAAVGLLRPGGALVFSTCTLSPLENEANVGWLLRTFPDMRLAQPPGPRLGGPGLLGPACVGAGGAEGCGEAEGGGWLSAEQAAMVQRFMPGEGAEDTIGFFIARFEKDGAGL